MSFSSAPEAGPRAVPASAADAGAATRVPLPHLRRQRRERAAWWQMMFLLVAVLGPIVVYPLFRLRPSSILLFHPRPHTRPIGPSPPPARSAFKTKHIFRTSPTSLLPPYMQIPTIRFTCNM